MLLILRLLFAWFLALSPFGKSKVCKNKVEICNDTRFIFSFFCLLFNLRFDFVFSQNDDDRMIIRKFTHKVAHKSSLNFCAILVHFRKTRQCKM